MTVRLYASDPQGELEPTAGFAVHDEDGNLTDSGALLTGQPVSIFDSSVLTDTQFGILDLELFAGGGSISVEYSAFGRFSVSMNGNCVEPLAQ